MDIREIEEASGMTRANIRFYEKEGLLTPERRPNGYRDYSQADVETLKKIKLLRRLELPVETIRLVQQGEEPLAAALARAEVELGKRMAGMERTWEICHDLCTGSVSYQTLDAQRYLDRFGESGEQDRAVAPLEQDQLLIEYCPWRRFFARTVDTGLYELVWLVLTRLILHWDLSQIGLLATVLQEYFGFALMLLIEPILLSTLGTTPGKFILGLELRDINGAKLTWSAARFRTWGVFGRGAGWGIPFYSYVRLIKCYRDCAYREPLEWEGESRYTLRDTCTLRLVILGVVMAVMVLAAIALVYLV